MKLRLVLTAGLFATALASGGGAPAAAAPSPAPTAPPAYVVVNDPAATAQVAAGAYLTVALAANVTTGYGWQLTSAEPAGVLTALGSAYLDPPLPAKGAPPMVGVGGTALLLFHAIKAGSVTLTFAYRRPWEKNVAPARTAVFHIVVK